MTDGTSERAAEERISRRAFLGGAAGLAGALVLGLEARPARGVAPPPESPLALAFWDGTQFIPAARLRRGGPGLSGAGLHVTVQGRVGAGRTLRGLSAYVPIGEGAQVPLTPFHAWAGSPHGSHDAAFSLPRIPAEGLRLTVRHTLAEDAAPRETPCLLALGDTPGQPKLRAGTYVLAARETDWNRYRLANEGKAAGGRLLRQTPSGPLPADFDHLILTVRRA